MLANFLKRRTNNGKAIITGKRVNRGAGYGLEIPCSYIFYEDNDISIPWLRERMESTGVFLHRIALGESYNTVRTVETLYKTFCNRSL